MKSSEMSGRQFLDEMGPKNGEAMCARDGGSYTERRALDIRDAREGSYLAPDDRPRGDPPDLLLEMRSEIAGLRTMVRELMSAAWKQDRMIAFLVERVPGPPDVSK